MGFIALTILMLIIIIVAVKRMSNNGSNNGNIIKSFLREGDYLFSNVSVSNYDGKAEIDNVVVNNYGVFIIETKYYNGDLYGDEDDYEWEQYKNDRFPPEDKTIKNPIKQVKRHICSCQVS